MCGPRLTLKHMIALSRQARGFVKRRESSTQNQTTPPVHVSIYLCYADPIHLQRQDRNPHSEPDGVQKSILRTACQGKQTTENRATTASSRLLFFWGDHFWHLNMITLPRQARDKYSIAKTHLNNVSFRPLGLPRGRLARLGRICLASYRRLGSWR